MDAGRVGIGGFSDGASYALSLGLTNGDLFTHVLAFSPGFMRPASQVGRPKVRRPGAWCRAPLAGRARSRWYTTAQIQRFAWPRPTAHWAQPPQVYISHGVHDAVLSIQHCSRRLVPRLQHSGYSVAYREFDGPHVVPDECAREAVELLCGAG